MRNRFRAMGVRTAQRSSGCCSQQLLMAYCQDADILLAVVMAGRRPASYSASFHDPALVPLYCCLLRLFRGTWLGLLREV